MTINNALTYLTDGPWPPCKHCSLMIERRDDGNWYHRSLNRRACSTVSPHTTATPDSRYT